jgi:uncharacterized protein YecE (DUF72 family)
VPSAITSGVTVTPASVTGAYVGTSGFSYASWRGGFYPERARPEELLRLYAERLPSVELNTTSYRLPAEEQFRRWAAETPPGFRFAVKMPRRITHGGRLDGIGPFCERVRALGDRLGPVLVQLPEERPRDDGLLELLLGSLDPGLRYAFDFRHPSWVGASFGPAAQVNELAGDGDFRYLRLREPPYDEVELEEWAERLRALLADGVAVYAYFKHEDEPTAPRYAERLARLVAAARR